MNDFKRNLTFVGLTLCCMFFVVYFFWQLCLSASAIFDSKEIDFFLLSASLVLCFLTGLYFCYTSNKNQRCLKESRVDQSQMNETKHYFHEVPQNSEDVLDPCKVFLKDSEMQTIFQKVVHIAEKNFAADQSSVMILNEEHKLEIKADLGTEEHLSHQTEIALGESVSEMALNEKKDFLIQGDLQDQPFFKDVKTKSRIQSGMICPIIYKDKAYGTINFCRTIRADRYTAQDLEKAKSLARQVGLALYHAKPQQTVKAESLTDLRMGKCRRRVPAYRFTCR